MAAGGGNTAAFVVFAASFFYPRTGRDWRPMGAFTAFLLAMFTEMYGVPLTVYLLSGWLGSKIPGLQATHSGGHLLNELIGWTGDAYLSPFHLASYALIGAGFWLMPPVAGVVMIGFLVQWPTIPTLVMFPILVVVYTRLARAEGREVAARFGTAWRDYVARTPAFVPQVRHAGRSPGVHGGRRGISST